MLRRIRRRPSRLYTLAGRPLRLVRLEDRWTPSVFRWNVDASGNWNIPSNWQLLSGSAGAGFPNAPGDGALFTNSVTANRTITIPNGVTITIGNLQIDDDNNITIASAGTGKLVTDNGPTSRTALQVNSSIGNGAHTISAAIQLNGGIVLLNNSTSTFTLSGGISESGGPQIVDLEGGTVRFAAGVNNSYTGQTTVKSGTLELAHFGVTDAIQGPLSVGDGSGAAGSAVLRLITNQNIASASSVIVKADGLFDINNLSETTGSLTVQGGSVTIGTGTYLPDGAVTMTGGSITSTGSGKLQLSGSVTTNANSVPATINGNLDLGGATRTFTVADGAADPDLDIAALVSNGDLTKAGAGTLAVDANSTGTGANTVNAGVLQVNGVTTRPTTVNSGGVLRTDAAAQVGALSINSAVLDPGSNSGIGVLTIVGNAVLGPSAYVLNLGGPTPTACDQIVVQGTVNVGNATPNISVAANFSLAPGAEIRLIDNDGTDPVVGTFSALPQGKTINLNGVIYAISYTGGTGNDVVLQRPTATSPRVTAVQSNNGAQQRSMVTSLTVTFSTVVTLPVNPAQPFTLARIGDGVSVNFNASASNATGVTVVTLNGFSGAATNGFGSLANGRYTLRAAAGQVTANGLLLDGDGDGNNGDDFVFTDSNSTSGNQLYRLFGDADGNRVVNAVDLGLFRSAFGAGPGDITFDNDLNGVINVADLTVFRVNFGATP
jgi:autotransporter-associated beta strand protein